jgi:hypothetical protein
MRAPDGPSTRYDPRRYASADAVKSERIRSTHDYWQSKRNDGGLPLRAWIDPLDIPRLLPYLMLIEVIEGHLRYRLAGTQVVANAGFDFTGRYLDELQFANRDFYLGCYRDILETRMPVFGIDHWVYPNGRNGVSEFAMLPLSSDGQAVSHFLTAEDNVELES